VLAAVLAQPLLAQPRLLHSKCCQLSAGFFRPVRRTNRPLGEKWNIHFFRTFPIEKNNSVKKKCHKSRIYMPREYKSRKKLTFVKIRPLFSLSAKTQFKYGVDLSADFSFYLVSYLLWGVRTFRRVGNSALNRRLIFCGLSTTRSSCTVHRL
jgi:hypothetical protein